MTIKELFERLEEKHLKAIFTIEPNGDYAIRLVREDQTSNKVIFSHECIEDTHGADEMIDRAFRKQFDQFLEE